MPRHRDWSQAWQRVGVFDNGWTELAVEEYEGELWLVMDTAMSGRYPGDPGGLVADKQWGDGTWLQGADSYEYPPSKT